MQEQPRSEVGEPPKKKLWVLQHKKVVLLSIVGLIIVAGIVVLVLSLLFPHKPVTVQSQTVQKVAITPSTKTATTKSDLPGVQLDTSKDYGNKYANGILPVGDGKYVSDAPKTGYVYACTTYIHSLQTQDAGASSRGPWFTDNNTEYDVNKKIHVEGSVNWPASFTNIISGTTRTISTNDLPNHPTGTFPVLSTDPAAQYDRNPNTITAQNLVFALTTTPTYNATPQCMGGVVGIMLTGVQLNSAFDAGGRDAGAWEIQDECNGHPQQDGEYHYHTLSSCIKDVSVSTVIGFALDGFPITGPNVTSSNILTTSDLDECHGITSMITLDGKSVDMYHYVMTEDFPYSVSCYRGTPIQAPGMPTQ